jgi:hypothetical protein
VVDIAASRIFHKFSGHVKEILMNRSSAMLRHFLRGGAPAVVAALAMLPLAAGGAAAAERNGAHDPGMLPGQIFVASPPPGATGPDDITRLATEGVDGGRALIWTAYQNGINPDGTPGTPGGPTKSTVAGYDPINGTLLKTISVTGKVDGLTADPRIDRLVATVNEDDNSALYLINVRTGEATRFRYDPTPAESGNGGTDSIAIWGGDIVLAHSNPNDTEEATDYVVTLDRASSVAHLRALFFDDSRAVNAVTHTSVALALTDPDTNSVIPEAAPRFAGQLATISQADGQIIFASREEGAPDLRVLNVTDNVRGNVPPIDGLAVATADRGTLFVVDAKAGTITALMTKPWPAGTVFVAEPSDNGNPLLGTLNLFTGAITPLSNAFLSPKGLLFVPA